VGLAGKFVVAYSGKPRPGARSVTGARPRHGGSAMNREIVFLFVGGGPQRDALATEVSRRGLTNVAVPSGPASGVARTFACPRDLHLVTLRAGCERFVFPSKLYGIAAVGGR